MKLMINALLKSASGIILICLILFLPAGTFDYPNAWLFMTLLLILNEEKVLEQGLKGDVVTVYAICYFLKKYRKNVTL